MTFHYIELMAWSTRSTRPIWADTPNMGLYKYTGLIIGSRGPQHFAKALPSEDGGEHPGEARWRPTCAWGWPVGYPRSYSTEVFIPLRGHSVERGSNNED